MLFGWDITHLEAVGKFLESAPPVLREQFAMSVFGLFASAYATAVYVLIEFIYDRKSKTGSELQCPGRIVKNAIGLFLALWFLIITLLIVHKFTQGGYMVSLAVEEQGIFFIGCLVLIVFKISIIAEKISGITKKIRALFVREEPAAQPAAKGGGDPVTEPVKTRDQERSDDGASGAAK